MKNKVKAVSLSLLLFSVTACSGGGGSGSRDTVDSEPGENNPGGVIDNELPSASILFPAQPGLWTDQQKIVIRGTSHDNAGIARVTVNGVEAESTDGFDTWSAELPLHAGTHTQFSVEVSDTSGNTTYEAATTAVNVYNQYNGYRFCSPIAYDSAKDVAYTFNPPRALSLSRGEESPLNANLPDITGAAFDPASGNFLLIQNDDLISYDSAFENRVVVSPAASLSFGSHPQIAIDDATGTIYVMDWWASYVVAVDPVTGVRSRIGSWKDAGGNSVNLATPGFQVVAGRLFVSTETALYELDPENGTAVELSGPRIGDGPQLINAAGLSINLTEGKAYIGDFYNQILEIDLSTGNRQITSSWTEGAADNQIFEWLLHGFADAGSRILVNSCLSGRTFAIDKQTGQRQLVSRVTRGTGPLFTGIEAFHFDEFGGELIAVNEIYRDGRDGHHFNNAYAQQLISVSPNSGDRTSLSTPFGHPEPLMGRIRSITTDPRDGTIFAVLFDPTGSSIIALSRNTQKWRVVSAGTEGAGPQISSWSRAIAFDKSRNQLLATALVPDRGSCLMRIDPATSEHSILACAQESGTDHHWRIAGDIALDSANDRAYVADVEGAIVAVNLETGEQELLSGLGVGSGPELIELGQIALDKAGGQLLVENFLGKDPVTGKSQLALVSVDVITGHRVVAMSITRQKNEQLSVAPAVDQQTGAIYLGLSNLGIALFDRESKQHLIISQ
ncbi:hypothetical protein [Microbulbifer pacificus]|uniref:hypothetical protein n=1 Tax=Microbulbifer pacificus TaxID=407164 RepID=UPI000CF49A51|nr:hypothetical protein [Microbulbifer pacificus]